MSAVPEQLPVTEIAIVGDADKPNWAIFDCPCGTSHRIQLSLQSSHRPHWRLRMRSGLATLSPSIWSNEPTGCHFWVVDGRVVWVTPPNLSRASPLDEL
jgi:hypothetical protein